MRRASVDPTVPSTGFRQLRRPDTPRVIRRFRPLGNGNSFTGLDGATRHVMAWNRVERICGGNRSQKLGVDRGKGGRTDSTRIAAAKNPIALSTPLECDRQSAGATKTKRESKKNKTCGTEAWVTWVAAGRTVIRVRVRASYRYRYRYLYRYLFVGFD